MNNFILYDKVFKSKYLFIVLFLLLGLKNHGFAQISVDTYFGVGQSLVSDGVVGDFSTAINGNYAGFSASAGGLLTLSNVQKNLFSAYSLALTKNIKISHRYLNIGSFYVWRPFSVDLREVNIGLLADIKTRHFGYALGLNSRKYSFSNAAKQKYNLNYNISVTEPLNLMYRFSYFNSINRLLLFDGSITNYDKFTILQETNPMFIAKLSRGISHNMQIYSELCYMQSGFFNVHVGYFGFLFRGGMIWTIN
jgi:hypothetical protein